MLENIGRFIKSLRSKSSVISSRGETLLLNKNDYGKIDVEINAIERTVERTVKQVEGIEDAKVIAEIKADVLKLRFSLNLAENHSVQSVSNKLVSQVREELEKIFAILEVEIYVKVMDVKQAEKKPKRRVR